MDIAQSPTRQKYPLSTKKIVKKTVSYSLLWVIIVVGFLIFFNVVSATSMELAASGTVLSINIVLPSLLAVVVVLVYLYQVWYFKVYYYDLNPDFIVIKKGPITPREITIPYERVQDVYVDQDIFDRIFGLYDVHLSSATISSGMEAHIDGVEKQAAEGLREELLTTVRNKIGKNPAAKVPPPPPKS